MYHHLQILSTNQVRPLQASSWGGALVPWRGRHSVSRVEAIGDTLGRSPADGEPTPGGWEAAAARAARQLACLLGVRGYSNTEPGWEKAAESQQRGSCQVRECVAEQLLDMQWQLPRPPWLCWLTACLPKGGKAWATLIRCSFGEKWTFCHSSPCGYCKENKRIQSLKKKIVTGYWPTCQ